MKIIIRLTFGFLIIFVLFSGSYWIKNQLSINIFDEFNLSNYFPFNYLLPEVIIENTVLGYVTEEKFDDFNPFGFWKGIYSGKKNIARRKHDTKGYNSTKCLLVICEHEVYWAINSGFYIKVSPGDTFHYKAKIKLGNSSKSVGISIISHDENRLNPKYSFVTKKADMDIIGRWQDVSIDFTILGEVHYIMLRIWGLNHGIVRFDEIVLKYTGKEV